jgi:hypothetical protein
VQPPRLPGLAGLSHRSRRAWLRRAIAGLCSWSCAAIREGSCRSAQAAHSHARGRALHAHAHTHTHTHIHTHTHKHTHTRTRTRTHTHTLTRTHACTNKDTRTDRHEGPRTHVRTQTQHAATQYTTLQHRSPHCNTVRRLAIAGTQCPIKCERPVRMDLKHGTTKKTCKVQRQPYGGAPR